MVGRGRDKQRRRPAARQQLTVTAGAEYRLVNGELERVGKRATECTCGQGWTICDYCWERGK